MNYSLLLDTSNGIFMGLLNDELHLEETVMETKAARSSKDLHFKMYNLLNSKGIKLKDLENLFLINGPGSYTGLRVGEGIAQFLEWQKGQVTSFLAYELLAECGICTGCYVSNAFKNEVFVFDFSKREGIRIDSDKIEWESLCGPLYYSDQNLLEKFPKLAECDHEKIFLYDYLKKQASGESFTNILSNKSRVRPFYYRSLDEEFSCKK
jgi:tRNA threonylcarbamoyladenosine biosynthesis protein TsaB